MSVEFRQTSWSAAKCESHPDGFEPSAVVLGTAEGKGGGVPVGAAAAAPRINARPGRPVPALRLLRSVRAGPLLRLGSSCCRPALPLSRHGPAARPPEPRRLHPRVATSRALQSYHQHRSPPSQTVRHNASAAPPPLASSTPPPATPPLVVAPAGFRLPTPA